MYLNTRGEPRENNGWIQGRTMGEPRENNG